MELPETFTMIKTKDYEKLLGQVKLLDLKSLGIEERHCEVAIDFIHEIGKYLSSSSFSDDKIIRFGNILKGFTAKKIIESWKDDKRIE